MGSSGPPTQGHKGISVTVASTIGVLKGTWMSQEVRMKG